LPLYSGHGRNGECGEHGWASVFVAEHCTLTQNVKAGDFKPSFFLSDAVPAGASKRNVPHCGVKPLIGCGGQAVLHRGVKASGHPLDTRRP